MPGTGPYCVALWVAAIGTQVRGPRFVLSDLLGGGWTVPTKGLADREGSVEVTGDAGADAGGDGGGPLSSDSNAHICVGPSSLVLLGRPYLPLYVCQVLALRFRRIVLISPSASSARAGAIS